MKKGMERYATNKRLKRLIEKGYFRKHIPRGKGWKTPETSGCDRNECGRQVKEKEEVRTYEKRREEEVVKTHQEGLQGVPSTIERRPEIKETNHQGEINGQGEVGIRQQIQSGREESSGIGSEESGSRCSSSRHQEVRGQEDGSNGKSRQEEKVIKDHKWKKNKKPR